MTESWASSEATRAVMQGNRRRDTAPELAVRRLVHSMGLRYRVDYAPLTAHRRLKADMVFAGAKVAVFLDGCFWHGCPDHHRPARVNSTFWANKVKSNAERDLRTDALLRESNWLVLRFWEHEPPESIAETVRRAVTSRGATERRPDPPP
ncbi:MULTISPECIES: very short patch repair endonuclease [unclassified Mycobacterium]|uniref:very short patch repair endonuclease n=1 Tax=unclassified Mycobacterium TaxID=2642494 RepID=UPI000991FD01|nr:MULTISPECIES: very short patch repair endonuclease [unclassified Mycobacterium]